MVQDALVSGFEALGVGPRSLQILKEIEFTTPTPIQEAAIPLVNAGLDVIGIAQTGTGKTLAFGLPMLDLLLTRGAGKAQEFNQGLVLAPTRELAIQIADTLFKVGRPQGLRIATLIGGAPMNKQVNSLRARPDIIVATPGRLEDHLHQRTMNLNAVRIIVLDEADRMLDMGFEPAIRRIMGALPERRQTLLFSATLPPEIESLANGYLRDPEKIEIKPEAMTADLVSQELVIVKHEAKLSFLRDLLAEHEGSGLIFARTRHGARKLAKSVRDMGYTAAEIHADRTLAQRRTALEGFRFGEFRFLIATDIAARGIDVKAIGIVINFDLPDQAEDYVHRIGRTGRAGLTGRSVTFATPDQHRDVRSIERIIRKDIPLSESSPLNPNWPKYAEPVERPRGRNEKVSRDRNVPFIKPHHRHGPKQAPASQPNFKPGPRAPRPENVDLGPTPEPVHRKPWTGPSNNESAGRSPEVRNDAPRNTEPRNVDSGAGENRNRDFRAQDSRSSEFRGSDSRGSEQPRTWGPRNDGPRNDGPRNNGGYRDGGNRDGGYQRNDGPRNFGPRNFDRPNSNDRFQGDRPQGDRPRDDFRSNRPDNGRPENGRFDNGRPGDSRPGMNRSFGRPNGDRPYMARPDGPRPERRFENPYERGPRPERPFRSDDNFRGERPQRPYSTDRPTNGGRPTGFRNNDAPRTGPGNAPFNRFGNGPGGNPNGAPRGYMGNRPWDNARGEGFNRGDRPGTDRPYGNRPSGDRPAWNNDNKPRFDGPRQDGPSNDQPTGHTPPKRQATGKAVGKFTPKKFKGPKPGGKKR